MDDSPDAQGICHLYKHRAVFQVNHFFRRDMGDIQCHFKNICIGFPEMNETGADKKINKFTQSKRVDPVYYSIHFLHC